MSGNIPKAWIPLLEWQELHYSKQNDFIRSLRDYWETVFVAGNGTGKSHTLYWQLICLALGVHPHQIAPPPLSIKVLLHDFEHGYGKIFTETCCMDQYLTDENGKVSRTIKPMLVEDEFMVKKWPSRDDKTIYFYNKSLIFFQTSEQKKRQHSGTNFDILACDEEPTESIYDESKRGLRSAKGGGRILHAFTPPFDEESKRRGPSWTKFKLVDPFEKGEDPDVMVIRASMAENPAITKDFIRRFSKNKTEEQIRIQIYGDYPKWGDMIFPEFSDNPWDADLKTGHLLPYDYEIDINDPDLLIEYALDWHGSKPPAVIWSAEYLSGPNKGDVIVFDEISPLEGEGFTISQTAKASREHEGWTRSKIVRWGDPKMMDKNNALISGFSPWEEFRHCGIRLKAAWNREPYVGYSIVRDYLRGKGKGNPDHPRLFIKENCKTLIHNMKNHYNVPRSGGLAAPDAKFSDYCVNLKYILQGKSKKNKKNLDRAGRAGLPLQSFRTQYDHFGRYRHVARER
jgi:hypothetical protein